MLVTVTTMPAIALDLKTAYQAALVCSAGLLGAKAGQEESEAGIPAARAALLPQLSFPIKKTGRRLSPAYLNSKRASTDSGKQELVSFVS